LKDYTNNKKEFEKVLEELEICNIFSNLNLDLLMCRHNDIDIINKYLILKIYNKIIINGNLKNNNNVNIKLFKDKIEFIFHKIHQDFNFINYLEYKKEIYDKENYYFCLENELNLKLLLFIYFLII
jgi:hypothetical protein